MLTIHLSEQFVCQFVVTAIKTVETMGLMSAASGFLLVFLMHFPEQLKAKKKFTSFVLLNILLLGVHLANQSLPVKPCSSRQQPEQEPPPAAPLPALPAPERKVVALK